MSDGADDDRLVLEASGIRATATFIGTIVLTILGVGLITGGGPVGVVLGLILVAFFGVIGVPALALARRRARPRVELAPDGLTTLINGRRTHYPWSAVTEVKIVTIGFTRFVGFGLDPAFPGHEPLRQESRDTAGVDASLPPAIGRPEDVMAAVEGFRRRFG
jgi:hypothetical protein